MSIMPYEFLAIDKAEFKDWIKKNIYPKYFQVSLCAVVDSVQSVIARISTRGRWIEIEEADGGIHCTCSVCNNDLVCIEGTPKENNIYYCPYCGAKMDLDSK